MALQLQAALSVPCVISIHKDGIGKSNVSLKETAVFGVSFSDPLNLKAEIKSPLIRRKLEKGNYLLELLEPKQ